MSDAQNKITDKTIKQVGGELQRILKAKQPAKSHVAKLVDVTVDTVVDGLTDDMVPDNRFAVLDRKREDIKRSFTKALELAVYGEIGGKKTAMPEASTATWQEKQAKGSIQLRLATAYEQVQKEMKNLGTYGVKLEGASVVMQVYTSISKQALQYAQNEMAAAAPDKGR